METQIKIWESRIEEIKRTGNCMNGNPHMPAQLFSTSGQTGGFTKEEMIKYCEKMIERIKNNFDGN